MVWLPFSLIDLTFDLVINAIFAGRVAARNMTGKEDKFNSIPFFWTVQFGKSLRYCGEQPVSLPPPSVTSPG